MAEREPARSRWALRSYFVEAPPPTADEVTPILWNPGVPLDQAVVLEQYKLCVEIADRVNARRSAANTGFVTLNTAILAALGVFWRERPDVDTWWLVFPLVAVVAQCLTWFWTIRSYRQVSVGKWAVIGALEAQLPASPYWRAEWTALGKGRDPTRYWPLSQVEQVVPLLFAATYAVGFLVVVIASP